MNGVEVLNTIQGKGLDVAFIVLAAVLLIFAIILVWNDSEILFVVCMALATVCLITASPQKTQYKVTISDNVSFEEFNEKYEVIKQEGDIFTVEMRENDD